jgi:sec-independent protein translocase protein TatA
MIPNVGPLELVIVLVIALIVLGPKKLPEFGRSVGKGMREFKGALTGDTARRDDAWDDDDEADSRYRRGVETPQG